MNKITSYTVVGRAKVEDIIVAVNEKIGDGWQPFGNLLDYDHDAYYYQVMVKYNED